MANENLAPMKGTNSGPFWEGAKQGKLMLPHCGECNRVHWYPRFICPFCHSMNLDWVEGSGEGTVHTFAVQHLTPPAFADQAPYVTAYIDLKEGDRMLTILRGVDPNKPQDIQIGAKVRVEFEAASEDMHVPYWRVVED